MTTSSATSELFRRLASLRDEEAHLLRALAAVAERRQDAPNVYSQQDGERPPGCGKAKYLRMHRAAIDAGDKEAWREGRARIMTAACWIRVAVTATPAARPRLPMPDTSEVERDLLFWVELGAAPRNPTAEQRAMMVAMNFEQRVLESRAAQTAERARKDAANAKRTETKRARYGPSLRRR